jgi:murein DD-endopeptidase MepM/ murein hydrolase activator NlpD
MALPLAVGLLLYKLLQPYYAIEPANINVEVTEPVLIPQAIQNEVRFAGTSIEYSIKRNDTLEHVFRQQNLSLTDLAAIRDLPDVKHALDVLKPGDSISLTHVDGVLQSLERRLSNTELLAVTRDGDGFKSEIINTPVTIKIITTHGSVDSSLYASAKNVGLSADVIMRMANDIFGWDIDFALDIRSGDQFTIIYEQQYRDTQYLGDGRILAAEFINDHRTYRAVRYESADEKIANYFTPEGRSMRKQFLRSPVDFTHISSGFSLARFHPILNTIRAHKGIDYAAPTGTPIKASGDGRVEFAGTKGGYGNAIILDHGAGITTLYGHMSRFATARTGAHVTQGQIIGYVGRTGAATGPHLHYEYRINGTYKDPRTVALPDASPIPMSYLADFHQRTDPLLTALDRGEQKAVAAAAPTSQQIRN